MTDIRHAIAVHDLLRRELLAQWPELIDDEEALRDSLDGISDLSDIVATMLRSALADERMVVSIADYIDKLQQRKQRYADRTRRKRALALHAMQEGELKRIERPDLTAFVGVSAGKVIITDEAALGRQWLRIKSEPDKVKIGDALKAGVSVEGACLSNPEPRITVRTS